MSEVDKLSQQIEEVLCYLEGHQLEDDLVVRDLIQKLEDYKAQLNLKEENSLAHVANVILARQGLILKINLAGKELLGVTEQDLFKKPFSQYLTPTSQDLFFQHQKEVFLEPDRKKSCLLELEKRVKEKSWVYIESIAVKDEAGNYNKMSTVLLNISAIKENQEMINTLYHAIEQSPTGIVITDRDGLIEYVNPKFLQLTGYCWSEIIGENPAILNSGRQTEQFYKQLWDTIINGNNWSGEFYNLKKNGEGFWERAIIAPVKNQTGAITHFVKVAEDITEQKKVEGELEYKIELEKLITNLALNFINLDLEDIEREIKKALQLIGVFTSAYHGYIFKLSSNNNYFKLNYSWNAKNSVTDEIKKIELDNFPWLNKQLKKFEPLYIKNINQLTKNAEQEIRSLTAKQVTSLVLIPMEVNNLLTGILMFTFSGREKLPDDLISVFRIAAEMFLNALNRKKDEEKIRRSEEKLKKYTERLEYTNQVLEETYNQLTAEMEKGRELHEQFLPKEFPQIEDLSFGAYYQPARELGGDFYNVFKISDKIINYVVDITGHGLDGAILNIFVRESINSFLFAKHELGEDISPKELIGFIHQKFCDENFPDDYFICIMLGILDLETMEYTFSNAGFQVPLLLADNSGELKELALAGLPLTKAVKSAVLLRKIDEKKFSLQAGQTIIIATDGLTEEMTNTGEMYGLERMKKSIKNNYFLAPQLIVNGIISDFEDYKNDIQTSDDITIFALQYKSELKQDFYRKARGDFELWEEITLEVEKFLYQHFSEINLLMIGLKEIIFNAIEHGNNGDFEKDVTLAINLYKSHVCIKVTDEGEGFAWQDRIKPVFDYEGNSERGRGIAITQMAYDYLYYQRPGNKAVMVKIKERKGKGLE